MPSLGDVLIPARGFCRINSTQTPSCSQGNALPKSNQASDSLNLLTRILKFLGTLTLNLILLLPVDKNRKMSSLVSSMEVW